jgi:hypothetical protein
VALAAALVLAGPRLAAAGELNGRADLTVAQDKVGLATSEYFRQVYYADYHRQVSQPIGYWLSLRFQDDQGTTELVGERTRLHSTVMTPTAGIDWRLDTFALSAYYRLNHQNTDGGVDGLPSFSQDIERFAGSIWIKPFQDGDVTLSADRLAYSSPTTRSTDDRLSIAFRYASGPLVLDLDNRLQRYQDTRTNLSRLSMGPRLSASYSATFGESGSLSASYVLDYFRTEQEVKAGAPTTVATELRPSAGLYVQDDLPLDTDPMLPVPALIDRAFDTSAGISIGTGGSSFQNLALDLAGYTLVDQVVVHVRNLAGVPIPYGGPISWTVFWSRDGLLWTQVDGASASFDVGQSAWRILFPVTSTRFIKVVTFGVNTVDTQVTELQAFVTEPFRPGVSQVSSAVRQLASLNGSWRPWSPLLLVYAGQLHADALTPSGLDRRWYTDHANAFTAQAGPFRDFTLGAGLGYSAVRQPFGQSQTALTSSASAKYQPIERADGSLEASRTDNRIVTVIAVRAVTSSALAATHLAIYESLRLSGSLSLNRQVIEGGGTTEYVDGSGLLTMNLNRSLDLDLNASGQRTISRVGDTSAQELVPYIRIITYQRYTAQLRYHPSVQLSLLGTVGYLSTGTQGGPVRSVSGTWSPFPGGAVQLNFDFFQEVDPLSGRTLQRLTVAPRWNMNRYVILELSYNVVSGTASGPGLNQNLYLTLSVKS